MPMPAYSFTSSSSSWTKAADTLTFPPLAPTTETCFAIAGLSPVPGFELDLCPSTVAAKDNC